MKLKMIGALGAAALLLIAGQASAQDKPGTASFEVGGVGFTVPIPAGYCLPTGKQAEISRYSASLDKDNVTDLSLVSCGAAADPLDYILIKTQVPFVSMPMERKTLIDGMVSAFGTAPRTIDLPATEKEMEQSLSGVTGKKIDIAGGVGPRGVDETCYYMGGVMNVHANAAASDAQQIFISIGSCMTAVGGRALAVHFYGRGNDPATVPRLGARAKAFALTIRGGEAK